MNMGKCPHCKFSISNVVLEAVTINPGLGFSAPVYAGVTYLCPSCHCVLGVSIDPVALKTDTVSEVVGQIRRG